MAANLSPLQQPNPVKIPLRYYLRAVAGEITFEEAEEQTRDWFDDLGRIERDDRVMAKAEKEDE